MQLQIHFHGQSGDLHEALLTQGEAPLGEPQAFLEPPPG